MANPRTKARIEARIHERAAHCLEFELADPRASFVTVTRSELTTDLSSVKIFYSVLGTDGDRSKVQHMLEDATGFVRSQLGRVLKMRRIPAVVWIYDDSIAMQDEMEHKIRDAMLHDRDVNPGAHDGYVLDDDEADAGSTAPEGS